MARSNFPVQDFIYKHFPWAAIFHAKRNYGFEWLWLIRAWREAEGGGETFLGFEKSRAVDFYSACAERMYNECSTYACIYGQCTVLWDAKRGNIGGMGVPMCPCASMDDPRDLERGPLNAKT
jgi:hypothetical protein